MRCRAVHLPVLVRIARMYARVVQAAWKNSAHDTARTACHCALADRQRR